MLVLNVTINKSEDFVLNLLLKLLSFVEGGFASLHVDQVFSTFPSMWPN